MVLRRGLSLGSEGQVHCSADTVSWSCPSAFAGGIMKLLLRRDQRSGMLGKVVFCLDVRADLTDDDEKREILKSVGSNLFAHGKEAVFPMFSPFNELREWTVSYRGAPARNRT